MVELTSSPDCTGPASVYNPAGDVRGARRSRRARGAMIVLFVVLVQIGFAFVAARYAPTLLPAAAHVQ